MSLDETDLEHLERRCARLESPLVIRYTPGGTNEDKKAEDFLEILEYMCGSISVKREPEGDGSSSPFELAVRENIIWCGLPEGNELDPFFSALAGTSGASSCTPELSLETRQNIEKIDLPVRLTLYVTPACPHCPTVAETVLLLAGSCPRIHVKVIDAALFSEKAREDSVMSVPCLILDDGFRWTGTVSAEEITGMILHRDPAGLSAETLKNILEQGEAAWIGNRMIEQNIIFPEYIKLLFDQKWPVRLGAIVVAEEIAQKAPELAAGLERFIFEAFDSAPVEVKGDLLYTLGVAGDRNTADRIEEKAGFLDHPELKEAAFEAVSEIKSRS
ncbi:MAG: thioredoxin family protein [Desulfobacteraceae bacterium]